MVRRIKRSKPLVMTSLGDFFLGWADERGETDFELRRLTREIAFGQIITAIAIFLAVFFGVLALT